MRPPLHPADPEEAAWVRACRQGERDAFRPLVERYQERVFRIARRLLGSDTEAQDATQDAFLKAYRALHRYDASRKFSTWLYRIAVNACIDRQRQRRELPEGLDAPAGAEDASHVLDRKERARAVAHALARLPENYRTVLVLKDIEDLDYATMAEILGDSIPALKIRVVRGRAKLAELIRKLYPELLSTVLTDGEEPRST